MSPATYQIALEDPGYRFRTGFTVWNSKGKFVLHTASMKRVLARRASYFRVNSTGFVYELVSRQKTVQLPAGAIHWVR